MMQRSNASFLFLAILPLFIGGCTDDSQPVPARGGAVELTFAGDSASNVDTTPLPATDVVLAFKDTASKTRVIGVFAYEPVEGGFRRKVWQLALSLIGDPVAGASYTIVTTAPSGGSAMLQYEQLPTPGSWLSWEATGGSISVDSVSGSMATFSLSLATMVPSTRGSGNQGTGTFNLSGTLVVDNID